MNRFNPSSARPPATGAPGPRERRHARTPGVRVAAIALLASTIACAGDHQIERPTPLYRNVPIEYPLELWDRDIEGETLVRVKVNDTGGVDAAEVLESSGYAAFDSAAVAGAMNLRFSPARRNGKRIEVWARVPVLFTKRPGNDSGNLPGPAGLTQ